jgi:DNA-binding NarL/FixJ family response regulator
MSIIAQSNQKSSHTEFNKKGKLQVVDEAIKIAAEHSPNVILVEGTGGYQQCIEMIKDLHKHQPDLTIIVMLGQHEPDSIKEVLQAGATGLVMKKPSETGTASAIAENEPAHSYAQSLHNDLAYAKPARLASRRRKEMLTRRQQEILKLLVQGFTNKQIAGQLRISVKTVDAHRASIMTRLNIHNLAGLVKYAIRIGLTSPE